MNKVLEFAKKHKKLLFFLGGVVLLIVLDQATKWIAQNLLSNVGNSGVVIPNFLYFTLYHNTKIAFSWGIDGVGGRILNIAISLVMSVAIALYWVFHDKKFRWYERTIAMLLLAGAVGNLIDRAFYWSPIVGFDGVIDFIQFYLGGGPKSPASWVNPFATFNMADAYLSIGIVALLIYLIVDMIKNGDKSYTKDPRLNKKPQSIEQNNADGEKTTSEEEPKAEEQGE